MSYSGPIRICECDGWTLDSYGNGAAYTLRLRANGESRSCFFQGDDAAEFRNRFDSWQRDYSEFFADYVDVLDYDAEMYG